MISSTPDWHLKLFPNIPTLYHYTITPLIHYTLISLIPPELVQFPFEDTPRVVFLEFDFQFHCRGFYIGNFNA